jgi:prevent-host-death family protein
MAMTTLDSNEARLQWRGILDNANKEDAIITRYGKPVAVVVGYDAWLGVQEELEEFRARQRVQAAIDEWRQDPTTARPWADIQQEMIAEGLLDGV